MRQIELSFSDKFKWFHLHSLDGQRVINDDLITEFKKQEWFYTEDGHCGIYGLLRASQDKLSNIVSILEKYGYNTRIRT